MSEGPGPEAPIEIGTLVVLRGPDTGREFPLSDGEIIIGRQAECEVCLESQAVSRQHARIRGDGGRYTIEDLQSSNGTYVNGRRLRGPTPLSAQDTVQVGPYVLGVRQGVQSSDDENIVIRDKVAADPARFTLHGHDAMNKLRVVLEISQHLARTLDREALLGKLLDHLLALLPQADRGMVLVCEKDQLVLRAQRSRRPEGDDVPRYSRTIVKRALADGVGILSEDLGTDERFQSSATLASLNLRSLLCVPLICQDGRRLGALQMDCGHAGKPFQPDDLQLVTAVGMQAAVALDNAGLHAELLREERLRRELALARDIQNGFLPTNFPSADHGFELYARIQSAREVSGDLYDFFSLKDGRLVFFVGDVAGKGIPAALFIIAVRALSRYIGSSSSSPAETLDRLNAALAVDNFSGVFVTMLHGVYDPKTAEAVLCSGGHPPPLLLRKDGSVEEVPMAHGRFLGFGEAGLRLEETRLQLAPGETLVAYTDGFVEAHAPDGDTMFGVDRLKEVLGGPNIALSFEACAERAREAVERFTGGGDRQDDLTLLFLRRVSGG